MIRDGRFGIVWASSLHASWFEMQLPSHTEKEGHICGGACGMIQPRRTERIIHHKGVASVVFRRSSEIIWLPSNETKSSIGFLPIYPRNRKCRSRENLWVRRRPCPLRLSRKLAKRIHLSYLEKSGIRGWMSLKKTDRRAHHTLSHPAPWATKSIPPKYHTDF